MISQKQVDEEKVTEDAALDGIYVIRTSLEDELSAADAVRHHVEPAAASKRCNQASDG
jgi:hypothetical protein